MTEPSPPRASPELRPYLDTIADHILSGHAAALIGAGFSKNAEPQGAPFQFPDWPQLGDIFYERLHGHRPKPNDKYLNVPTLANQVQAMFGRPELHRILRNSIPDLQHKPSPLHVELLELPWSDVFTTNYDTLLERAAPSVVSRRYDLVLNPEHLYHSNRPRIIKLHGTLPSENLTITDDDYRRYPRGSAPFVNAVRQALLENTLCLIGFSGDDPNFLQWIDWIQDSSDHADSPKIYFLGVHELSLSHKAILQHRNIIPLDLSWSTATRLIPYHAFQQFFDHLRSRRARDDRLAWPQTNRATSPSPDAIRPDALLETWKTDRHRYPGWVVLPDDLRLNLWLKTSRWIRKGPPPHDHSTTLDLEFAFELTWRTERCLCPIFDDQTPFIEATLDRYWPLVSSQSPAEVAHSPQGNTSTQNLTLEEIRYRCHHLLLAMMRYYRQEGLSAKWNDARVRILTVLPDLCPEHSAQFHYERALFALFIPDLQQLKARLSEWMPCASLPFWGAKKAGLLAEIGQLREAEEILEHSLTTIRATLKTTANEPDYRRLSEEALVMVLLNAVRRRSSLADADSSDVHRQRLEFRERRRALRNHRCDPWQEIETFEHKLQRPPAMTAEVTERPAFDIGRLMHTHHFAGANWEVLTAYNFLLFCEDAGIPFRMPGRALATAGAAGTLARIVTGSPYWARATAVRIGDTKAVDAIFDRASLTQLDIASVDILIERYVGALRSAAPDIAAGDRQQGRNLGTLLAGVLPEILSRLSFRSSEPARQRVLDWLLEVYRSDHRSSYQGIRSLMARLFEASSVAERFRMVPKLLQFPILADLNAIEEGEYESPFSFVRLQERHGMEGVAISGTQLDRFITGAISDKPAVRRWSVSVLGALYDAGLLEGTGPQRFAGALWSRLDEYGLPSGTDYYRFAFLSLPHPTGVDPVEPFMRYVRGERFPVQESRTHTRIEYRGEHGVALCRDIRAATDVRWPEDDVRSIVRRLVEWWDNDKAHWRRAQAKGPGPSIAPELRKRLSELLMTLATMVLRYPNSVQGQSARNEMSRVAEECVEYRVPGLRLEIACSYGFATSRDSVLKRVEDAMGSSYSEVVIDALDVLDLVSYRTGSEADGGDLLRLVRAAGEMIRWRRETALWATMNAMGEVVSKHPWVFVAEVEDAVLTGLGHLISETAVQATRTGTAREDIAFQHVSGNLLVRQRAAGLAYRLFEHYRALGKGLPDTIADWEAVCQSNDEFLDIKNQWLKP